MLAFKSSHNYNIEDILSTRMHLCVLSYCDTQKGFDFLVFCFITAALDKNMNISAVQSYKHHVIKSAVQVHSSFSQVYQLVAVRIMCKFILAEMWIQIVWLNYGYIKFG